MAEPVYDLTLHNLTEEQARAILALAPSSANYTLRLDMTLGKEQ
jgi:hypothetical protein